MVDRFYKQQFRFSDGSIVDKYIWLSDLNNNNTVKFPVNKDGEIAEPYFEETTEIGYTVMNKMDANQIRSDRKKRSSEHFKREVFDTLPKADKKHFAKKYPELQKRLK